jgi:lysophospholipase L1-like esterase
MVKIPTIKNSDNIKILCFGDSITECGEWVATLGTHKRFETINAGKSGRQTVEAKKMLAPYLEDNSDLDKIIMFLGVNDLPARDKRPSDVKVNSCVKNMSDAIDLAITRFKPENIILVAPCNVSLDTMNDVNFKKGYNITPPLLVMLEGEYKSLAKKRGILFVSLLNVVSKDNYKDGVHPNEDGDSEIAKAILNFLIQ